MNTAEKRWAVVATLKRGVLEQPETLDAAQSFLADAAITGDAHETTLKMLARELERERQSNGWWTR